MKKYLDLTILNSQENFAVSFDCIDFTTRIRTCVQGTPENWMRENGYDKIQSIQSKGNTYLLGNKNTEKWAIYTPEIESQGIIFYPCLFHNIPTLIYAEKLMASFTQWPDEKAEQRSKRHIQELKDSYGENLERIYKSSKICFMKAMEFYLIVSAEEELEGPGIMKACIKRAGNEEYHEGTAYDIKKEDENIYEEVMFSINLTNENFCELLLALVKQVEQKCWSEDSSSKSESVLTSFFNQ